MDYPLAYTQPVLSCLLHAITSSGDLPLRITQASIGKQPISWFANLVFEIASKPDARRKAPFIIDLLLVWIQNNHLQ